MKIAIILLIALLSGCDSKWNPDMPDDGTMLCSMAGEGFVVVNNAWGFHVDRRKEFDNECTKRVK
jgi:hypothetical protein